MNIIKKFFLGVIMALLFIPSALADEGDVVVNMFERDDCKHCQDERAFLEDLQTERTDFEVHYYDLEEEPNYDLWKTLAELEGMPKVTPITLIGDTVIQGFDSADTTGLLIQDLIDKSNAEGLSYSFEEYVDMGGSDKDALISGAGCDENGETCDPDSYEPLLVTVPFVGPIDVKAYSLPVLSLILGFVDGFNPCAMWVLVTFLIVLVQVGDKRKMWQIAGLFILAEAIMYYLILNVWFELWDFIGLDRLVTPIIGGLAIAGGLFFLWEGWKSDGECKVTNLQQRSKTKKRINRLIEAEITIATIVGIIALALSVNIIEFACSVGIPQAFTKILEINDLSFIGNQFYMFLYILMYMVDDVIVFGIALYSFEKIGLTKKYSKYSNILGGVLMLILGALLIWAPNVLVL